MSRPTRAEEIGRAARAFGLGLLLGTLLSLTVRRRR